LDPIKATDAAARLLRDNLAVLETWPLTITSYNHGKNGMLRAKKRFGKDFRRIVDQYQSRYFGFASRNFYSEFLAALEVAINYREYFGEVNIEQPLRFDTIPLKRAYDSSFLTSVPGFTREVLAAYNPHLKGLSNGSRRRTIPGGIDLRVPSGQAETVLTALESAGGLGGELMMASDGSGRYRVQPGDVLSEIAFRFGTSARRLQQLNNIRNANKIYPGQVLLVLKSDGSKPNPIPLAESRETTYVVRRGDHLTLIARRFGTSVKRIQYSNDIADPNQIHPGMRLRIIPGAHGEVSRKYTVQSGDTLSSIATRFGTSVSHLKQVNGLSNPNRIHRGQKILIP
jgi:membrane-bound lytic murein transglycosylase D